jgi:AraC family transcriptional regulator, regulatory protein of adaptative response / methylated-DNA-[protein]-cysteine methyltransferase
MNRRRATTEQGTSPEWQAILERDARFDGAVYYGVHSTGIYCKPSCPSRKPKAANVQLFFDADEAERAGFRACLRCRPKENGQANEQIEIVRVICRYIEKNIEGSLSLRELGSKAGFDPTHLQKIFKRVTGVTPRQYIEARRLSAFKLELRVNRRDVTNATYEVGYGSSSRVYERAAEHIGMTPATYRKGAPGVRIRYAIGDCSLGRILLAATDKGICCVKVGDSDSMLLKEFYAEFPQAELERNQDSLGEWLRALIAEVEGKSATIALPIDIQLTAFQRRVYEALRRIPRGETRSYSQLAVELGNPKGCRAVARACATNPVAIVIPCHRIVGTNGSLTGYRWGIDRKKALLEKEQRE